MGVARNVRPLYQHGPHQRGPGGEIDRRSSIRRLAALVAALVVIAGCGGNTDVATTLTAEDLLPDLSALGFARSEVQRAPFSQLDEAGVLYGDPASTTPAIKLIIYVLVDEAAAQAHFNNLQTAFEAMPVAALLADPLSAGNPEDQPPANALVADGPEVAEQTVHFRTKTSDRTGQHVWTDIHRIDSVVVVVQALAREKPTADEWRDAAIAAIADQLPGS